MQRLLCCVLCLALILVLACPVSAATADSSWVELLETATVGNTGQNWFNYTTSATISIPTPRNMRCTKIDMLVAYTAGMAPAKVELRYNGTLYKLTIDQIDNSTARIYGDIPDNYYADMVLIFTKSGTSKCYLEVLSCRVTPLNSQSFNLSGQVYIDGAYLPLAQHHAFGGVHGIHTAEYYTVIAITYDWAKYDTVCFFGSIEGMSLESIRVTLGQQVLPFTVNYIDVESGGVWEEWIEEHHETTSQTTGDGYAVSWFGQYLYSVTVDLSNVDRTKSNVMLQVTFTGQYDDDIGGTFNCQSISGTLAIPDTGEAYWRSWGKNILSSIQTLPERIAEELSKLYKPDEGKIESVQQQSQELAQDRLGAVYQAGQVIDGFVGAFQNQTATEFLTVPVLTVPLGEVNWSIGGWTVQVVPDAFKPIVEILKTVIDIVCTLAFVKSMRSRFERLLAGGNA